MIKIIAVGKIKENYLKEAINDYQKRINKYHKLEIIEIEDDNIINEKDRILKHINKKDFLIALDIQGTELTSIELSKKLDNIFINNSNITFIIGGSNGIHDSIKNIVNYKLSFSKMTFPHQLFRLILLEQIYRSFKILNNETYHK
ncbi:MAG: 23S rRNA (pseudouridine(1915)-N(3))-methyltransferase RlmH [Tenericutes bacterium]|nr:23S rRNA (pseudouridine(1915)-N(3))-methyltransferase RlmH [Mycoplasmatota bacterium]